MSPAPTTSIEDAAHRGGHGQHAGLIGPNAVIQLGEALGRADLGWVANAAFAEVGVEDWLAIPPILKLLPSALATRTLVPAIRAHAWTFVGSGHFSAQAGSPTVFEVADNPLCAHEAADHPVCAWHAAVFERLFSILVSSRVHVVETACAAQGDSCCRFVADWRGAALH